MNEIPFDFAKIRRIKPYSYETAWERIDDATNAVDAIMEDLRGKLQALEDNKEFIITALLAQSIGEGLAPNEVLTPDSLVTRGLIYDYPIINRAAMTIRFQQNGDEIVPLLGSATWWLRIAAMLRAHVRYPTTYTLMSVDEARDTMADWEGVLEEFGPPLAKKYAWRKDIIPVMVAAGVIRLDKYANREILVLTDAGKAEFEACFKTEPLYRATERAYGLYGFIPIPDYNV